MARLVRLTCLTRKCGGEAATAAGTQEANPFHHPQEIYIRYTFPVPYKAATILNMFDQAYISLTKDLVNLDGRGSPDPSELLLTGNKTFPLLRNSQGQVLMAASFYAKGRIVVLGLESYMAISPALVDNVVTWLRGEQTTRLSVMVHQPLTVVSDNLQNAGVQVKLVNRFTEDPDVGVYITDADSVDADANKLVAFMKAGGGVLIAGQAWHWASQNPNETIFLKFPGNKVSGVAGIYFTANHGENQNLPFNNLIPTDLKDVDVGMNFEKDLQFLLDGTSQFDLRNSSLVSEVLVHGPLSFPIGVTYDGRAFLAGGYYGRGRVVFIGHEAFMYLESMSTFWKKAFHWLDQGRSGVVGVMHGLRLFPDLGIQNVTSLLRKDLSVFVCTTYSANNAKELQEFVAEGGGLLIGGHAWYWAGTHPNEDVMTDYSGNKILNTMGLSLLDKTVPARLYKAPSTAGSESLHFRRLLGRFIGHVTVGDTLSSHEEKQLKRLGRDCTYYLKMKAHDIFSYTQVLSYLIEVLQWGVPQVSENNPVSGGKDRLLLSLAREVFNNSPDPDALLPYLIKNNPLLPVVYNQHINITAATAGKEEWISTGLYLSPGMKTHMIMPTNIINKRWKVQIGCQTDRLQHDVLKRAAQVTEYFQVTPDSMHVWNLWGGLIYLLAPPNTTVDGSEVIVEKAVSAPYYKSGTMPASDWLRPKDSPAPWAELEFDNIILTLPSRFIRDLENPDKVARLWNSIMKGISELSAIPEKFPRKERIVADVQISAGFMHSGYPIMIHSNSAHALVQPDDARAKGLWGIIHELGHNQQRSYSEFRPHTTEATCNLWAVYVHEEKLGINRAQAHPQLTPQRRQAYMNKYIREGRILRNWNYWTALETYLQLQEMFGWDTFKQVFSAYQSMRNFPWDNPGKMNLYAETFSLKAGMNLTEFFKGWGWPIEDATVGKLSHLPLWSDYPMAKFN